MTTEILYDNGLKFNDLEAKIYKFVCMIGCALLRITLERRDKEIANRRDKKKYRHKGYKYNCVKTIMGEVEYRRAIYEVKDGEKKNYVFLLNEEVEISTVGKISANLSEKIIGVVTENSYRSTARSIEEISNQRISHEAVRNVVLKVGKRISDKEDEKVDLFKQQKLEGGKKEITALFEEADGLWISLQGKDKKDAVKRQKEKAQKEGKEFKEPRKVKSELKLYVSYEGWQKDSRHTLIGKQYITGFMSSKQLYRIRNAKLHERYNIENINVLVLNGDGASWIKKLRLKGQFYQKDSFHISQAILRNIKEPENRGKLQELVKKRRYFEINDFLESLKFECGGEEKQVKKLILLQKYLKDGLPRYKDEIKDIPKPPDGIEYREMGICESQIFSVLSKRFSDRRMSFSKRGATLLSKVLAMKAENKNSNILEVIETPIVVDNSIEEWISKIEEHVKQSKLEKKTKLKKEPSIKILSKPFEGVKIKEYMNSIRKLTGFLPFTELSLK